MNRPPTDVNSLGSQIIREIVIPQLTKEINENKNFAQLRQVYNSLILATWYKKKIKDSILSQVYADKNKISGIGYDTPTRGHVPQNVSPSTLPTNQALNAKAPQGNHPSDDQPISDVESIYQQYLQAFKKGVYNYIKEETDPITQQMIPRKYFSGGFGFSGIDSAMSVTRDGAMIGDLPDAFSIQANIQPDNVMAVAQKVTGRVNNRHGRVPAPAPGRSMFDDFFIENPFLMEPALFAYYMSIKNIVNPRNEDRTFISGASGVDMWSVLLATDARRIYMVEKDVKPDADLLRILVSDMDRIVAGDMNVFSRGYNLTDEINDQGKFHMGIVRQLAAMKLKRGDINITDEDGVVKVSFKKPYPGTSRDKVKVREVYFVQADMADPKDRRIAAILKEGIDGYFQKAAEYLPTRYGDFMPAIFDALRYKGFLITNDHTTASFVYDPTFSVRDRPQGLVRATSPEKQALDRNFTSSYGSRVEIRQKTDGQAMAAAPDAAMAVLTATQFDISKVDRIFLEQSQVKKRIGPHILEMQGPNGEKYFVKAYKYSQAIVREHLLYQIARAAGVHAPDVKLIEQGDFGDLHRAFPSNVDPAYALIIQDVVEYESGLEENYSGQEEFVAFAYLTQLPDFSLSPLWPPQAPWANGNLFVNAKGQYVAYDLSPNIDFYADPMPPFPRPITFNWLSSIDRLDIDRFVRAVERSERLDLDALGRYFQYFQDPSAQMQAFKNMQQQMRAKLIKELENNRPYGLQKHSIEKIRTLANGLKGYAMTAAQQAGPDAAMAGQEDRAMVVEGVRQGMVTKYNDDSNGDIIDPASQWYADWFGGIAEEFESRSASVKSQTDIPALEAYLRLGNNPTLAKEAYTRIQRALEQGQRLIIEIGSGDTLNAVALARMNPQALVLATDEYDYSPQVNPFYREFALKFESGQLESQTAVLDNLITVRSRVDIMSYLPDASTEALVWVRPPFFALKDLIVLANRFNFLKKFSSTAQIALLIDESGQKYLNFLSMFRFYQQKNPDPIFRNVALHKHSFWPGSNDLYVAVALDARNIGESAKSSEDDRAMASQRKIIFKVLDIDDKEIVETDTQQKVISRSWMGKDELLRFRKEGGPTRLMDLIRGFDGVRLSIVVHELLRNAINRQPNEEKVFVTMATFRNPFNQVIFKMTIHQKHITKRQWGRIQGNAQLDASFQRDVRVKRRLFEKDGGRGLEAFMTNFANHVPARLVFEKDARGGMTTTLWAKVDLAVVVQNTGGIDLTADKTPLEVKMDSRWSLPPNASVGGGNDKEGIKFNIDPAMLQQLQNAPGFVPVIINIQPMTDLRMFLGLQENKPEKEAIVL